MTSTINKQAVIVDELLAPQGLLLGSVPNLTATKAKVAYNLTDNKLWLANGATWTDISAASNVTLAAVGAVANANGASISASQVLNLQPANNLFPGVVTTGDQLLSGIKSFSDGVKLSAVVPSVGVSNLLTKYFYKDIGVVNVTGAMSGNIALSAQVIGEVCYLTVKTALLNIGCPGGLATVTETLDPEFRPLTAGGRGGIIPLMNANVYTLGTLEVSTAGVITFGIAINPDFTQTVWGINAANNNAIFEGVVSYSLL